ncbi:MAG: serine hydrolase domain-containing protein [Pseudomonadota bacterium]
MAQDADLKALFDDAASAEPRFAIAAAYIAENTAPIIMTAGPTVKNGAIDVAPDARWHIGSISKSFTATLIMRLVDRGVLELEAPIETYLPEYRNNMHAEWRTATLRQLLSHTAGVAANPPRSSLKATFAFKPYEGRRKVLADFWGSPLASRPSTFTYSNIGYVLAGFIAEEVTGETWEDLIISEIAEPLGLTSLGFGAPQEIDAPRGHRSIFGFKSAVEPGVLGSDNAPWMGPAGTIHLSMADLVEWGHVHIRACNGLMPDFLAQQSCVLMQTPIERDYGLGWVVPENGKAGTTVWHNGSNSMWYAILTLFPDKNTAIAVATNVFDPKRAENLSQKLSMKLCDC